MFSSELGTKKTFTGIIFVVVCLLHFKHIYFYQSIVATQYYLLHEALMALLWGKSVQTLLAFLLRVWWFLPKRQLLTFSAASLGIWGAAAPLLPTLVCPKPSPPGHQRDRRCRLRATGPGPLCPGGTGTVISLPGHRAVRASTPLPERSSLCFPGDGGLLGKTSDEKHPTWERG